MGTSVIPWLKATNLALQRKLAAVVQGRKTAGAVPGNASSKLQTENQEARYHSALHQWQAMVHEKERMEAGAYTRPLFSST